MIAFYQTRWRGDLVEISADFAEPWSLVIGTDPKFVTDFQHDPKRAMRRAVELKALHDGLSPSDIDVADLIILAVCNMVEAT